MLDLCTECNYSCVDNLKKNLVGEEETEDMIENQELPTKTSARGRTLYFYSEAKVVRSSTQGRIALHYVISILFRNTSSLFMVSTSTTILPKIRRARLRKCPK